MQQTIVKFENTAAKKRINDIKLLLGEETHTYFVETYGCQMNVRDSQTLAGLLEAMGYVPAPDKMQADVVIFNTCCVREGAEERVYGNLGVLRPLKEANPHMIIAVCGCMMQEPGTVERIKKRFKYVDIVFGTHNTHCLPELMYSVLTKREPVYDLWEKENGIVEEMPALRDKSASAFVNIMYGCDNFCSYCIVPYVRGRERSRRSEDIIAEAEVLVKNGVKEITLLGQNVNSYGKGGNEITFPELLRRLDRISGLERIRFMTSHPKDISDDLISAMAECEHVCKYLHLPVQSGSDRILAKMNRRYTSEKYLSIIEKLRARIPQIAISTDIIVGFPGEAEEDFEQTLELYRRVCFNSSYMFIYSPRTGTPAARMDGQIDEKIKKERMTRLIQTCEECTLKANTGHKGNTYSVLVENTSRRSKAMLSGRCDDGRMVSFEGPSELIGQIVDVKITDVKLNTLVGKLEET